MREGGRRKEEEKRAMREVKYKIQKKKCLVTLYRYSRPVYHMIERGRGEYNLFIGFKNLDLILNIKSFKSY